METLYEQDTAASLTKNGTRTMNEVAAISTGAVAAHVPHGFCWFGFLACAFFFKAEIFVLNIKFRGFGIFRRLVTLNMHKFAVSVQIQRLYIQNDSYCDYRHRWACLSCQIAQQHVL